ncbi:MAG: 2-C-methyl-D-erythritol 4-phosphate cytidylyltransferase [Chthoniobacterales bacterium]|nr:2-C-methyl-D-erythritol 4-phosphate cytidylyltransferase [Chthoniobacterales bacterium]
MLTAIIVAGGSSRRMGFDKTFAPLHGRPVIAHTIAAFEASSVVDEIILVGREERLAELKEAAAQQPFAKVRNIVAGGARRQDSVSAGLIMADRDSRYVAVHDAARCLVTPAQIERVFVSARANGAAALASPVVDTLKRATANSTISGSVDREGLFAMQTPQIFLRELLLEAYQRVTKKKLQITDEVSAVQNLGRKVMLVSHLEVNLKITYPTDLLLAEAVLARRREEEASGN